MGANKILTFILVRNNQKILLGKQKRGFGAGKWNCFGGKVERGESVENAALRELWEESGLMSLDMEKAGILMFDFIGKPHLFEIHVFTTTKYTGTVTEGDEIRPQWFNINKIPYKKMWPDDKIWFPYMLAGQKFFGYFTFLDMETIKEHKLKKINGFQDVTIPKKSQFMNEHVE